MIPIPRFDQEKALEDYFKSTIEERITGYKLHIILWSGVVELLESGNKSDIESLKNDILDEMEESGVIKEIETTCYLCNLHSCFNCPILITSGINCDGDMYHYNLSTYEKIRIGSSWYELCDDMYDRGLRITYAKKIRDVVLPYLMRYENKYMWE